MSEIVSTILDTALIGVIPVKIVNRNTHSLGEVGVGNSVGQGVRVFQKVGTDQPEQISLQCRLIGSDRFTKKFALEALKLTKIPFPFVTRLVALPLVRITAMVFSQTSTSKNIEDRRGVIDFSITLMEIKLAGIIGTAIKLATKIAWVLAANTTLDPANNISLSFSNDDKITPATSSVAGKVFICLDLELSIGERENKYQDLYYALEAVTETQDDLEKQFNASLRLDTKYDRLPLASGDRFPQTIKINYPKVPVEYENFNTEENLNEVQHLQSELYYFPEYTVNDIKEYLITITPTQSDSGNIITTMLIEREGETIFNSKIIPCEKYSAGDIEINFSIININQDSIYKSSQLTEIVGGIRLKQ